MKILSGFLERFSKLQAPERVVIEAVQYVLHEMYHYDIPKECVRVGSDWITLSIPSVLRQEVFKNKVEIIARVNAQLGAQRIFELR